MISTVSTAKTTVTQTTPAWQPRLSSHPLSTERSFYRSKIFSATTGINPLAAAASAVLTLIARCHEWEAPQDVYGFYQQLIHEIKAFEHSAQAQHYRAETILIARYSLCATLDELILHSSWGEQEEWEKYKLLMTFQNETSADERFFTILDRLCEEPQVHIDLLELMYLCLSLGFEGKYRHIPRGRIELENLMDRLFECIRMYRDELKKDFHIQPQTKTKITATKLNLPTSLIVAFMGALLLTIYSSFSYMLSTDAANAYQQLQPSVNTLIPNVN